ncbi:MAG TPA: RdgB/HAM1 family non-canonical purine NTP pyrophosphatase [Ignavibacteriaceae bacterium]|nr:RdgB/HAM1 family non-canonical purine NTP pyrophosphatase [Ignavibacteriaceae bacterium]
MKQIVFASKNRGKTAEVKYLFEKENVEIVSLLDFEDAPDVIEDGKTFEENARKKAIEIYDYLKIPVIADDSGLTVAQLNGEPGVYSARYAGEHCSYDDNNSKLINALINFEKPHYAKFVCAAVYYDGNLLIEAFGEVKGTIIEELRGDKGFGYDPLFLPDGMNKTLAELDIEVKNKISHRYKAFSELFLRLEKEQML